METKLGAGSQPILKRRAGREMDASGLHAWRRLRPRRRQGRLGDVGLDRAGLTGPGMTPNA